MLHIYGILHIAHILHIMYIMHIVHIYAYHAYLACIAYVAYRCILCQLEYCYFDLLQEQEKCGGGGDGGGGAVAAAAERAGLRAGPGGDRPGRRPGVAKPGRIRMSLRAMKSVHEPVVVGLAGMVQEQPATQLAGMDLAKIYINMQRICSYM